MRRLRSAALSWLTRAGGLGNAATRAASAEEAPLNAELFSAEQMAQHGTSLAARHELTPSRAADRLLPRLAANERVLVAVYSLLTRSAELQHRVSPAGEWLLDNFYFI